MLLTKFCFNVTNLLVSNTVDCLIFCARPLKAECPFVRLWHSCIVLFFVSFVEHDIYF